MRRLIMLMAASALMTAATMPAMGEVKVSYLYNLSDFNGVVPYTSPRVYIDDRYQETYVVSGNTVKVFNASCMEIFRFDVDTNDGSIMDLTTDEKGRIMILTYRGTESRIITCNYRGEREGQIEVTGLTSEFSGFTPNRIFNRNGELYLASYAAKRIAVIDADGAFIRGIDMAAGLKGDEEDEKKGEDMEIGSMNFTPEGDLLVSLPVRARIFRITKDGVSQNFGKRGSAPGRFGVPSGVAADSNGNIYVSDRLRCVVIVFDKNLKFIREFGFRGFGPGNLIIPNELTMDKSNRIYVTQQLNRGVSVYQIAAD